MKVGCDCDMPIGLNESIDKWSAILGILQNNNVTAYKSEIQCYGQWWDEQHLILNVKKTEKMVLDPKSIGDHWPVVIHNLGHNLSDHIQILWHSS